MAQGAWVRTPLVTVLGHDMVGDVKSALNLKGNKFERFIKNCFSKETSRVPNNTLRIPFSLPSEKVNYCYKRSDAIAVSNSPPSLQKYSLIIG